MIARVAFTKSRIVLAASAVAALSGCAVSKPPAQEPQFREEVQQKVEQAQEQPPSSVVFRSGDTLASAFRALGMIDGSMYIIDGDATRVVPGQSLPIKNAEDAKAYFKAHSEELNLEPIAGTSYVRVKVGKAVSAAQAQAAARCRVTLAGSVPMGDAVTKIANKAGLEVVYADSGATSYSGVLYPVGYKGSCAGALVYLARKADLAINFTDSAVEMKMMDTAAIDLGLPLRDRRIALDILADGSISGGTGSTGTGGTAVSGVASTGSSSTGSNSNGGSKSLQSAYVTNYLSSVRSILSSTRSPFGTWHYVPETGQVFIRDRAEAVAATRASLNRLAQAFYGRYEVTLTLYRMTTSNGLQVSGNIASKINSEMAVSFGSAAASVAGATLGATYNGSRNKSVFQLLSRFGAVETLDTFALTLQSGIPQTLKVANNTEYVRNVSVTSTGTTGATTSSVEQANATDGAFVTMQARQAEVGKIAIDFGAFINRLDGFDTTQTTTSVVKSQKGFERTFDTMAVVDDGVPYVASVVAQKTRTNNTDTLPGAEGATGALANVVPAVAGSKTENAGQTYIVVMIEARKQ